MLSGELHFIKAQSFGVPVQTCIGVGSRAIGMAHNYVALSNDASAMFWNPAGLAFVPTREFQISFNGFLMGIISQYNSDTKSSGGLQEVSNNRQRFRVNSATYLKAIPAKQGGLTFAIGFQSPYILDDIVKYSAKEKNNDGELIEIAGNSYSYGQINFWTASAGLQIAPNLGVGVSLSLANGKATMIKDIIGTDTDTNTLTIKEEINHKYYGYDIRLGLLYSIKKNAAIGVRIVVPSYMFFVEQYITDTTFTFTGTLTSSYSSALGASYTFPFMTITAECNAHAPHQSALENTNFAYWKFGAGLGIEIPIFESISLRTGYSWQEYKRVPWHIKYKDILVDQEITKHVDVDIEKDQHLLAVGFSYLNGRGLSLDCSYNYQFWDVSWIPDDLSNKILEMHSLHRIMVSFAIRF